MSTTTPHDDDEPTRGRPGRTGAEGATGATGAEGAEGAEGRKGSTGAAGESGAAGTPGIAGAEGTAGVAGTAGAEGAPGVAGEQGVAGPEGRQGLTGQKQTRLTQVGIILALAISAGSAIYYPLAANHRLDEAQSSLTCQKALYTKTIDALRIRNELAESQAKVALTLTTAQRNYLNAAVAQRGASQREQLKLLSTYQDALDKAILDSKAQLKVRAANPYPTPDDVSGCQ